MKISEIIARLPAYYYAALERGGPSFYFVGTAGGGKTSVLMAFPKIMKRIDPEGKGAGTPRTGAAQPSGHVTGLVAVRPRLEMPRAWKPGQRRQTLRASV